MTSHRHNARASGKMAAQELAQIRQDQKVERRKSPLASYTCVPGVDPLVREFFAEAKRQAADMTALGVRTGTPRKTFYNWRIRGGPGLTLFAAAVEALGGRLVIEWANGAEDTPNSRGLLGKDGPMQQGPLPPTAQRANLQGSAIPPPRLPESPT